MEMITTIKGALEYFEKTKRGPDFLFWLEQAQKQGELLSTEAWMKACEIVEKRIYEMVCKIFSDITEKNAPLANVFELTHWGTHCFNALAYHAGKRNEEFFQKIGDLLGYLGSFYSYDYLKAALTYSKAGLDKELEDFLVNALKKISLEFDLHDVDFQKEKEGCFPLLRLKLRKLHEKKEIHEEIERAELLAKMEFIVNGFPEKKEFSVSGALEFIKREAQ